MTLNILLAPAKRAGATSPDMTNEAPASTEFTALRRDYLEKIALEITRHDARFTRLTEPILRVAANIRPRSACL